MTREIGYLKAIAEAQQEEMRRDSRVFIMGEDVRNGVFGTTGELLSEFGPERVRDTPISESGFVGAAIGAAMTGMRPIVDFTIAAFVYVAMDQLVSHAAKNRYMFGGQTSVPVVFRATMFYAGSNAAQHSDRPYPMFMTVPGLKVLTPATAYDAKGLLKSAVRDDDAVMIFEDITLWRSKSVVPEEDYVVPIGVADVKRPGNDVTVVAIAGSLVPALAAAEELAQEGISVEVVDPRTVAPLDTGTILESAARTRRLVVVDPAHSVCSAASEIAAVAAEEIFDSLRAPIIRVTTPQTHVPFSPGIEKQVYPTRERIVEAVRRVTTGVRLHI